MANTYTSGWTPAELGNLLQDLLCCEQIIPGAEPSYQICKTIFEYHPLGSKLAQFPIKLAQSQPRDIAIASPLEEELKKAFEKEWKALRMTRRIRTTKTWSRVYGIASICLMAPGMKPTDPIDYWALPDMSIGFNILDPLNTAGSLVLNQDPNSFDFQRVNGFAVAGVEYHPSRAHVVMNGDPIYISYQAAAFGFTGRSVYQPVLYPLKSFINSMVTDDMVVKKAGLLIAMIKTVSSAVDNIQQFFGAIKRTLLQDGETGNVLQIGKDDKIETLNLQNLDGAFGCARTNILQNIATGDDMPAVMLNSETFANGFADGTEDAKYVAHYIDSLREEMEDLYTWADAIVMHKAWSPALFKALQARFPELLSDVDYKTWFYECKAAFIATWPNLLTEPDSEKAKLVDVQLKGLVAILQVIGPLLDPKNKAELMSWAQDNLNEMVLLFSSALNLDFEAIENFQPMEQEQEPKPGHPFAAQDEDQRVTAVLESFSAAVARLPERKKDLTRRLLAKMSDKADTKAAA